MISAQDFLMVCVGLSIVIVGLAFSVKILSSVRARGLLQKEAKRAATLERIEEPDLMGQRLQELRGARFGRPMDQNVSTTATPPQFKQHPQTSGFRRRQND